MNTQASELKHTNADRVGHSSKRHDQVSHPHDRHHGHAHDHHHHDHDHDHHHGHDHHDDDHGHHHHGFDALEGARIAVAGAAAAAVWFHLWEPLPNISIIGAAALLFSGFGILSEAFDNLRARRMTMELSMTLAIVSAAAISEYFTALVILLFVLVAEVLEGLTVSRGRKAIHDLLDVLPRSVQVRRGDGTSDVDTEKLAIGDRVLLSPGARVPVDGLVVFGHSFVDQSHITGEPMPVEKTAGSQVLAGSVNQSGALEVQVQRVGRDTSFGKIIEAVEQAERSRAPVQRLADQLAGYLVYFALASAAVTYALTQDIRSTISVIIVAGACGIAAGTPLAILGGIGRAARQGAIIKGGLFLETLGRVDTVLIDKTGTLTFGEPEIRLVAPAEGVSAETLLTQAAGAELRSEHPLGKAIVTAANARRLPLSEPASFSYEIGRGVSAVVDGKTILVGNAALMRANGIAAVVPSGADDSMTLVHVAVSGQFIGSIAVADKVRPDARQAVERLKRLGVQVELLTGDAAGVAGVVGRALGIEVIAAELLPQDKRNRVKALSGAGKVVAMIGDGINDAPALAEADVGIAMGSGTEVARESADIVLIGNDLMKFVDTLGIARRTRGIIWQNFAGTLAVDLLGIVLAGFGMINPLAAAFIHVASELTFILNSARLLSRPQSPSGKGKL